MQLTIYLFSVYTNMMKYGITIMSFVSKLYRIAITPQECERDNSPQIPNHSFLPACNAGVLMDKMNHEFVIF